jgi:EAL domain-containing protein (putative c-di-GMP-specific phosphodiesterase class I)
LANVTTHGKVFERILQTRSVPTRQVVIEVTENVVEATKPLSEAIGNYRDCGYRICVDDFGSKHSNFDRLWKLSPDFVKLDAELIKRAQFNPKTRRVLPKLIELIRELEAQPVVKGIENEIQFNIALASGATLLQGYYLGRPASACDWRRQKQQPPDAQAIPGAPHHFGSFGAVLNTGL